MIRTWCTLYACSPRLALSFQCISCFPGRGCTCLIAFAARPLRLRQLDDAGDSVADQSVQAHMILLIRVRVLVRAMVVRCVRHDDSVVNVNVKVNGGGDGRHGNETGVRVLDAAHCR
jgi:hypothetical protein